MNTLLLCCMRQTCPLRSELLLLLLTSMYATCIQPHIFRRIPLHMSSGSSRSQMCHTFECGAALHMFMCKRTKETPLAFIFRSVSLWDIPQSTRAGHSTIQSPERSLYRSMQFLMNATSLAIAQSTCDAVPGFPPGHSPPCLLFSHHHRLHGFLMTTTTQLLFITEQRVHPVLHHRHHLSLQLHHHQALQLHLSELLHVVDFMVKQPSTDLHRIGGKSLAHPPLLVHPLHQRATMSCCSSQAVL